MRFLRSKFGRIALGLAFVLVLFLTHPGAQSLRSRLVRSIGLALDRQVEVGQVYLRLLPRPGFELRDFVVHDDPAFSAEPVLRAGEVTATLRLSSLLHLHSLLHGQFEIARLDLTEPSFNLVRNSEGRWNIEYLLERAAKNPLAPTSKPKSEPRPGFPYIEASNARINFKFGAEKKPYALTEADLALWQDSENAWGMRLRAQPVRTDLNLTDTGFLRIEGSWQRAATLRQMPLRFTLQWDHAQLGQATKLASGHDKGWRGTITVFATLTGAPENLNVATDASVDDFRRSDINSGNPLRLAAHCDGVFSSADHFISNLACRGPIGDGVLSLSGAALALPGFPAYDLTFEAANIPAQSLLALARHAKKNLPTDLVARGKLDATAHLMKRSGGQPMWHGNGTIADLSLSAESTRTELRVDRVPLTLAGLDHEKARKTTQPAGGAIATLPNQLRLEVGPFMIASTRPSPAKVQAWFAPSGYDFSVNGDAEIQRLLALGRTAGLPAPALTANGQTRVDLHVDGPWTGFAPAQITGTAQLHSVHAEMRGLNSPVEINAANVLLMPDEIRVTNLNASAANSVWHGSLTLPRPCVSPANCFIGFNLDSPRIVTDELSQDFNPHPVKRPWYRFLSALRSPGNSLFLGLHAAGTLAADQVVIHQLIVNGVSASIVLENGKLQLSNLRGKVLGGEHRGQWTADFTGSAPVYSGSGICEQLSLAQLATAMHDDWVSGAATASYRFTASGVSAPEIFSSATASLQIEAHDGFLPRFLLAGNNEPLRLNHFVGHLVLRDRQLEIEAGKLVTPGGIYQVSGSASLDRALDLKLAREGAHGFNITGTLATPRITQTPVTQAALP